MKTWSDYKKTFPNKPDIFDFARAGDLRGLFELLQEKPETDLNQKNARGFSPLMLAVYNGQEDFAEALLRSNVEVDILDNAHNTPLMGASFKGNLKVVKLLLNHGAKIELKNLSNMTAFDWAKLFGRKEVVAFFLESYGENFQEVSRVRSFLRLLTLVFKRKN